jgi:hypothetical protein
MNEEKLKNRIAMQIVIFIPLYLIWRNDCKKIGKDNLAVSLQERFLYWLMLCPIWLCGFLDFWISLATNGWQLPEGRDLTTK